MPERVERLDWAERWITDSFGITDPPGGVLAVEVDMTRARAVVEALRVRGLKATYNHVVVRAAALALTRHPEIHLFVVGSRRAYLESVDIGLSVASSVAAAPIMILKDAGRRRLPELTEEIIRRAPEVRAQQEQELAVLRRWGWLLPFRWMRRGLLRLACGHIAFRRKLVGTFQVTCLPIDLTAPLSVTAAGTLGVGLVRDRVVAVDGRPEVRPTVLLSCAIDHRAWDGMRAYTFLHEVKQTLESTALDSDID